MTDYSPTPLLILGAVLGAALGVLIGLNGGDRADQLAWGMLAGVVLAEYLTLIGVALSVGRSVPQAVVASTVSAPIVILVGTVVMVVWVVVFGAVAFAVPVTVVLSAIYFLPPLSFIQAWEPEVIAAVTMPFVVLWAILLVRVDAFFGGRPGKAREKKETERRRVGRILFGVLEGLARFLGGLVGQLRSARISRWLLVPVRPWALGTAFVAALVLFVPVVLIDSFVFGYEYAERHDANSVVATVGFLVGGIYGASVGVVALVVSGLDDV